MSVFSNALDPSGRSRSQDQWRELLSELVSELGASLDAKFTVTHWNVGGISACADIRASLRPELELEACGTVCVTTDKREVWCTADLLFFSYGVRLSGPRGQAYIGVSLTTDGWSSPRWRADDTGEWELHDSNERWST